MLRVDIVRIAVPLDKVPVPRLVLPSLNVTVPVAADGKTVAVSVTDWPGMLAAGVTERVVPVAA
jgi:hypothetical protein